MSDVVVFSRQKLGSSWLIGIHGPTKEIVEQYHWLFLNHGATLANPCWLDVSPLCEVTSVFSTTVANLKRAFLSMDRIKLEKELDEKNELNKRDPKIKQSKKDRAFSVWFKETVTTRAKARMDNLLPCPFLNTSLKEEDISLKYLKEINH